MSMIIFFMVVAPLCNKQANHPILSIPNPPIQNNRPINPRLSYCSFRAPLKHPVQQIHYTPFQELEISKGINGSSVDG